MSFPNLNLDPNYWREQKVIKKGENWFVEGRGAASIVPSREAKPSNLPGKTWLTLIVTSPPGGATPPHTHNGAAIVATVIKGHFVSQMIHPSNDGSGAEHSDGPRVYGPGESWYEAPGCHHVRAENASADEEVVFVVNLVIDTYKIDEADSIVDAVVLIDAAAEEKRRNVGK